MNARRISLLGLLVVLNNALLLSIPANACGGPCPVQYVCLPPSTGGCDVYWGLKARQECIKYRPGTCCFAGASCADYPAIDDCNADEHTLMCSFAEECP